MASNLVDVIGADHRRADGALAVDRAAVACIRCGTDRCQHAGTGDSCATACLAAAAVLLSPDWDRLSHTPAILRRCADACEAVGADADGLGAEEYADCARQCRQVVDALAVVRRRTVSV